MGTYYQRRSHGLGYYLMAAFLGLLLGWVIACTGVSASSTRLIVQDSINPTAQVLAATIRAKAETLYTRPSPTKTRRLSTEIIALSSQVALLGLEVEPPPAPPPPPSPVVTVSSILITPQLDSVPVDGTNQYSTTGLFSDASTLTVFPTYSTSGGGTINASGLYTAGATPGTFLVIATYGSKLDTATIVLTSPAAPPSTLPIVLPAKVLEWTGPMVPASATPTNFNRYETDFVYFEPLRWTADGQGGSGGAGLQNPPGGCRSLVAFDYTDYYDRAFIDYQFWARTGNPVYRVHADSIARCYRDGYLAVNLYGAQPHNAQLEGLAVHYWLTGDTLSKKAVVEWAKKTYPAFPASKLVTVGETYAYWEGRIQARLLIGVLLCIELGDVSRPWGAIADSLALLSAGLQHVDGSFSFPSYVSTNQGTQANFSAAMLNYAWAKYYTLRDSNATILTAIKKNVDYLWSTQWKGTGFAYHNAATTAANDLSGMLVYGFGFYGSTASDASYFTKGDSVFKMMLLGFYNGQKQFNQQYRESGLYLGLRP